MLGSTAGEAHVQGKMIRAAEGERMGILLNHIKADKRTQFEHFIHDILMPAVEQSEPQVCRQMRVLHPAEPNEDGTFTYVFLMDPLIPEADYSFEYALHNVHPPEKAEEFLRMVEETYVSPQVEFEVFQSAW